MPLLINRRWIPYLGQISEQKGGEAAAVEDERENGGDWQAAAAAAAAAARDSLSGFLFPLRLFFCGLLSSSPPERLYQNVWCHADRYGISVAKHRRTVKGKRGSAPWLVRISPKSSPLPSSLLPFPSSFPFRTISSLFLEGKHWSKGGEGREIDSRRRRLFGCRMGNGGPFEYQIRILQSPPISFPPSLSVGRGYRSTFNQPSTDLRRSRGCTWKVEKGKNLYNFIESSFAPRWYEARKGLPDSNSASAWGEERDEPLRYPIAAQSNAYTTVHIWPREGGGGGRKRKVDGVEEKEVEGRRREGEKIAFANCAIPTTCSMLLPTSRLLCSLEYLHFPTFHTRSIFFCCLR